MWLNSIGRRNDSFCYILSFLIQTDVNSFILDPNISLASINKLISKPLSKGKSKNVTKSTENVINVKTSTNASKYAVTNFQVENQKNST